MNTEALLTLAQWMSPGFPVGAFAYSHGLEHVIDRGDLRDAQALRLWLGDILHNGAARSDVILLAAAYRAPQDAAGIDAEARAFAASAERLTETLEQGTAFARTVDAIWGTAIGSCSYPVAVGCAAVARGLPLPQTAELYVHAMMANLVSAAVRLVPLGQTEGQAVLAALGADIPPLVDAALDEALDGLGSACFALDVAAMSHETQYSKVFRT